MPNLTFKGKPFVQNHHLSVKYHQLLPNKKAGNAKKVSLNDNLIIHGDNLKALKALLPTYAGKIKCIYIDPPYNIGNEKWVYNDNVNSPMIQEWLGKIVDSEDLTRHDKWLCMMMPRLKLLRELLTKDGVIFISIDDNEVHHLRMLMNEIFGEQNFISNIQWNSRKSVSSDAIVSLNHNHTLLFAREMTSFEKYKKKFRLPSNENNFSNPDNDPRGKWTADPFDAPNLRPNLTYPIVNPNNKKEFLPPKGRCWRTTKEEYKKLLADKRIVFGKKGATKPQLKRFWSESESKGATPTTWWDDVGTTTNGTQELEEIFGEKVFENPKPTSLILKILKLATNKDSLVLDSFAGSGTTAQAVMAINKEDGGTRRFILIQLPEDIDQDTEAYKMGFREVVDITAERVRRTIAGVKSAKDANLKSGFGGSFSFFELGNPIDMESILAGKNLPSYNELARYVFYTATGEEFDNKKINAERNFIGESQEYEIYLFYKPDLKYLKNTALTLDRANALGPFKKKKRLVFAPTKYLDQSHLNELRIEFAQLPFEIYKFAE